MIISQTLQYNAPNSAPQSAIVCFGTCPSGTMTTTAGNTHGYIEFEYRIPAAPQRYDSREWLTVPSVRIALNDAVRCVVDLT